MNYEKLDNEELLRLALEAVNSGRDAESVVMLKTLLERDSTHVHAQYLLAAQHAQMGLYERAEAGFRAVVEQAPELEIARFQLGQLLALSGSVREAQDCLQPLVQHEGALGAYARALAALMGEDIARALQELEAGLGLPQQIPELAADMQRLRDTLKASVDTSEPDVTPSTAPIFLTGYSRQM